MHSAARRAVAIAGLAMSAACGEHEGRDARDVDGASGSSAATSANDETAGSTAALTAALQDGERTAIDRLPRGGGHGIVVGGCVTCHGASLITQQHKDSAGWNKTVTLMIAWGAAVAPAEKPVLVAYLTEHFGARGAGAVATPTP